MSFLKKLFFNPAVLVLLIIGNFAGSIWGFYWYHLQLAVTPWYLWPWVPDSPFSSSLITITLVFILLGRTYPGLFLWASLSCIKYGIWAVIINVDYGRISGAFSGENWLLTVSHLAMAAEGAFCLLVLPYRKIHVLWVALWFASNDGLDYLAGLHPYLFAESQYTLAWTSVLVLSIALITLAGIQVSRNRP